MAHKRKPRCQAGPHRRRGQPPPGAVRDYDAERYKRAAELAATQHPDVDPVLYDPDWYREQDRALSQDVLRWLNADTGRRCAWPITVPQRDRDLTRHLDHALPYPLGADLAAALIRAASAQVMTRHIQQNRASRHQRRDTGR